MWTSYPPFGRCPPNRINRSRAYEIPDVLNEQNVKCRKIPIHNRGLDHLGIEMAERSGRNLASRCASSPEALAVAIGRQVADDCSDTTDRVKY
jgi:hypothetical protein